ncbi:MAG: hypothetical protein GX963_12255 [Bacteroidales bacterium]|nr:hypothetical protein [Bacteroidales bacterium]
MKPLFPPFCRTLGFLILGITLLGPFLFYFAGILTDNNLLLYKEGFKLLGMIGSLLILFAYTTDENKNTLKIRSNATQQAMFLTLLFLFVKMVYRLLKHDVISTEGSSFLIFLIFNVICLEFGIKKSKIEKLYKGK